MKTASGTFDVKVNPTESSDIGKAGGIGRMTIDKTFSGPLTGTSKGEMLTGANETTGAMAYVAMEKVTGKLDGLSGSFLLSHNASMLKSDPSSSALHISVVAASGTDALVGLTGRMTITMNEGKHHYQLTYELPAH